MESTESADRSSGSSKNQSRTEVPVQTLARCLLVGLTYIAVVMILGAVSTGWLYDNDFEIGAIFAYWLINAFAATWLAGYLLKPDDRSLALRPVSAGEMLFLFILTTASATPIVTAMDYEGVLHAAAWLGGAATFSLCGGLVVAYRQRTTPFAVRAEPIVLKDEDLQSYTERVLSSDRFITALRSTLPGDRRAGAGRLGDIPFLLATIQSRRASFERSSQLFFLATVVFGLLFVIVVVGLGFVLIDELEVGLPRRLGQISENLKELEDTRSEYDGITRRLRRGISMSRIERDLLEKAEAPEPILEGCVAANSLKPFEPTAHVSARALLDFCEAVVRATRGFVENLADNTEGKERLNRDLRERESLIEELRKDLEQVEAERESLLSGIREAVAAGEKEDGSEESRLYGLGKRISVGLIIATFFLAILRYLTRQYSEHLHHLAQADKDDLAIRSFFVCFRNATSSEEKSAAIKQLIANAAVLTRPNRGADAEANTLSGQDKRIVGEILEIIKKRI